VLAGLNLALEMGAKDVEIRTDSQVIAHQIQGDYEAKGKKMKEYLAKVEEARIQFNQLVVKANSKGRK
jgi:ribonuclease HI